MAKKPWENAPAVSWKDAPKANEEPPRPPGYWDRPQEMSVPMRVLRSGLLSGRNVLQGAMSLPLMAANVPEYLRSAVTGEPFVEQNQVFRNFLSNLGLPEPVGKAERYISDAQQALGGAAAFGGVGSLLSGSAAPAVSGVGQTLAQNQALAATSALTGSGAASAAREELGAGPIGQIAAGLAGGMAPAVGQQILRSATARTTQNVPVVGDDPSAGLTSTQQQNLRRGEALGFRVTPGQRTGSRALQQFEAKLESQPITSGPFNALKANNQRLLNRVTAAALGQKKNVVDPDLLDDVVQFVDDAYRQVADDNLRFVNESDHVAFMTNLADDYRGQFGTVDFRIENHPLIQDIDTIARAGQASGRQLHGLSRRIGTAMRAAFKPGERSNYELGSALARAKEYVDDLLAQGVTPSARSDFFDARRTYALFSNLLKRQGTLNLETGNVSGPNLANTLRQSDRSGYVLGRNQSPLYNAARFSKSFPAVVGDSGTATRMPLSLEQMTLLGLLNSAAGRGLSAAYLRTPPWALAAGQGASAGIRATIPRTLPASGIMGSQLSNYPGEFVYRR